MANEKQYFVMLGEKVNGRINKNQQINLDNFMVDFIKWPIPEEVQNIINIPWYLQPLKKIIKKITFDYYHKINYIKDDIIYLLIKKVIDDDKPMKRKKE